MSPVMLATPPRPRRVIAIDLSPPPPIYREVECGYLAGRSLAFSIILHQLVLVVIILWGRIVFVNTPTLLINPPREITPTDSVMYLPTFGGGSEGAGHVGGGSGQPGEVTSSLPARSRRSLSIFSASCALRTVCRS